MVDIEYRFGVFSPDPFRLICGGPINLEKSATAALGMIPACDQHVSYAALEPVCIVPMSSLSLCSSGPEVPIVNDLPAPDCPYAMIETL